MNHRSLKQRLLRTRISLKQTLQRILDINRKRKILNRLNEFENQTVQLEEELRILNQLAFNQASLVKKYEKNLAVTDAEFN
jgi:adenylate cyclase class IV